MNISRYVSCLQRSLLVSYFPSRSMCWRKRNKGTNLAWVAKKTKSPTNTTDDRSGICLVEIFIFIYLFGYVVRTIHLLPTYQKKKTCRIHWLHLCRGVRLPPPNAYPGYDTKQSDGKVPVMLETWEYGVPLHCHCSQVYSVPPWWHLSWWHLSWWHLIGPYLWSK